MDFDKYTMGAKASRTQRMGQKLRPEAYTPMDDLDDRSSNSSSSIRTKNSDRCSSSNNYYYSAPIESGAKVANNHRKDNKNKKKNRIVDQSQARNSRTNRPKGFSLKKRLRQRTRGYSAFVNDDDHNYRSELSDSDSNSIVSHGRSISQLSNENNNVNQNNDTGVFPPSTIRCNPTINNDHDTPQRFESCGSSNNNNSSSKQLLVLVARNILRRPKRTSSRRSSSCSKPKTTDDDHHQHRNHRSPHTMFSWSFSSSSCRLFPPIRRRKQRLSPRTYGLSAAEDYYFSHTATVTSNTTFDSAGSTSSVRSRAHRHYNGQDGIFLGNQDDPKQQLAQSLQVLS